MYANRHPDSDKGKVFAAFQKSGKDAARKLAAKLGVANSRANRWLSQGFDWNSKIKPKAVKKAKPKAKPKKKQPAAKPTKSEQQAHAA